MGVCELGNLEAHVNTAYKRKAQKVRPVDASASDGSHPGGDKDWKTRITERLEYQPDTSRYGKWVILRITTLAVGSQLTPE